MIGGFMKKLALLGMAMILCGLIMMRKDDIITIIHTYIKLDEKSVSIEEKNDYYRDYDFLFVQNTNDFVPKNNQDILNIYYTAINAGKTSFTFYCPKEYAGCLDSIEELANDQDELSDINNFVHPYNGFSHIETEYDSLGKVTINIIKSYKEKDIRLIEKQIDILLPQITSPNNTAEENIKSIHDYIINHSKYDSLRSDQNIFTYKSDTAYGPLFEGYAICSGYTDLMELFLEKLQIRSFKVSSEDHVWNAVYLNNRWYHLDLTWDDPVASDGRDYLEYNYFLIDTNKLLSIETTQHTFNQNIYQELKQA